MANWPFRFIHAGDLHLEQPPQGVAEVPDHLRRLFLESAYWAARRVFDTALAEEVDFLLLSGDVLNVEQTGPRGPLFLVEQFQRLAERGIAVYWSGGQSDPPDSWPSAIALPDNVHRFPVGRPHDFVHRRDANPLTRVIGASRDRRRKIRAGDFDPDPAGLFSIAVVQGTAESEALQARGIHYWALGGRHDRSTLFSMPNVAHYPGSPQGRRLDESGTHGCTLVEVDAQGQVRTSLVPCDVMRWHNERVVVEGPADRDAKQTDDVGKGNAESSASLERLERTLGERMRALIDAAPGVDLMVSWTLAGTGPQLAALRRGALRAELLERLRREYGYGPPAAWSLALDVELSATLPSEWYEQETIRGDFLRAIRQLEIDPDVSLDLEPYLAEEHLAGTLGAVLTATEGPARGLLLGEAAWLGIDLLSGEEAPS